MAVETSPELITDAKAYLIGEMVTRHADWSDARFHRDRAGGNSAERNADFNRENDDMNHLLDIYIEMGYLAVESE